ncbi:ribonuclease D [candidate division KSB3 bacterium]|nr:ribonuclease D [candidate division KSB3 bacterium]
MVGRLLTCADIRRHCQKKYGIIFRPVLYCLCTVAVWGQSAAKQRNYPAFEAFAGFIRILTSAPPANQQIDYIDTAEDLVRVSELCRAADRIAIDTEADSLHHYFEKVCLIQISVGDAHLIVDPLAIDDLDPLLEVLAEKTLLFHGGDYDLHMLNEGYNFVPAGRVFDTMLAAQLLGHEQLGLAALVERYFHIKLPKDSQKSDWSKRPLPQKLLDYAMNDTRYLEQLVDILERELRRLGRIEWHREACDKMIETALRENVRDPEREWRVKGSSKLSPPELSVLRALWYWRDEEARRIDRPVFMVLGNRYLVDFAKWAVKNRGKAIDSSAGPKLPRNIRGRRLQGLNQTIRAASNSPRSDYPAKRPPKRQKKFKGKPDDRVVAELSKVRDNLAEELQLPASVLAPKATLQALSAEKPLSEEAMVDRCPMMQWQAHLLADVFLPILSRARENMGEEE